MNIDKTAKLVSRKKTRFSNLAQAFYKLNIFKYLESASSGRGFLGAFESISEINKKKYLETLKMSLSLSSLPLEKVKSFYGSIKEAYSVEFVYASVGYRFVAGMGYPSPVENGFLLHHTYGVPYISGESVKGLARFVYIYRELGLESAESEEDIKKRIERLEKGDYKEDELKKEEKLFINLFGTQKKEGKVIFFDAYPTNLSEEHLVIDIMNPHYGEYYKSKGKNPPVDWDKPNPIFFLALEGVEFCFAVGYDPLRIEDKEGKELLNIALSCLREGLEIFGLGGKRRKGYGWFEVNKGS